MAKVLMVLGILFSISIAQGRDPISDHKMQKIVSEFQYEGHYEIIELKDDGNNKKNKRCHRYIFNIKTSYPSSEDIFVTGKLYTPNPKFVAGEIPFVVQLPPMGGTNVLDRWMGGSLCKADMAGFIIDNDFTGFDGKVAPPVEDHDHAHRRTIAAMKAAIAFAHDDPRFNGQKVGLLGVSLGGILGSMAMNVLDEISASYFIVSGADLPHVIASSKEKRVSKLRKIRMKEEQFQSTEEYEEWLRLYLDLDPFDTARRVPTESIFMVVSTNDTKVPTADQFLLFEAYNRPEHRIKNKSHVGTVINTLLWPSNRRKVVQWYKERFELDNPRLQATPLKEFGFKYLQNY